MAITEVWTKSGFITVEVDEATGKPVIPPEFLAPERQTRADSFMEAATNIAVGLAVSQAANLVVLPLVLGVHVSQGAAFSLGVIYTAISLVRQYVLRRAFNGRSVWQAVKGCWA